MQLAKLEEEKQNREKIAKELNVRGKSINNEILEKKKYQELLLDKLLELSKQDEFQYSGVPFKDLKGKLAYPVSSYRIITRFGQIAERGAPPYDGILFSLEEGSDIRAVHNARVIFSDWFRGYGFMIILDHGGGYISIYGNNKELLVNENDVVNAGDVIAKAGDSGGVEGIRLYFSIRNKTVPENPQTWLKRQ